MNPLEGIYNYKNVVFYECQHSGLLFNLYSLILHFNIFIFESNWPEPKSYIKCTNDEQWVLRIEHHHGLHFDKTLGWDHSEVQLSSTSEDWFWSTILPCPVKRLKVGWSVWQAWEAPASSSCWRLPRGGGMHSHTLLRQFRRMHHGDWYVDAGVDYPTWYLLERRL